jgi:hypothetical protein
MIWVSRRSPAARTHSLSIRMFFLLQWFDLSDPQAEGAIYEGRCGASRGLGGDVVPDETTTVAKYSDC